SRSGSSVSPRAVEPLRSQKTTVTVLRCSFAPAGTAANEKPHSSQNFAPSLFACPQLAQTSTPTRLDRIPTHDNRGGGLPRLLLTRLGHPSRVCRSERNHRQKRVAFFTVARPLKCWTASYTLWEEVNDNAYPFVTV